MTINEYQSLAMTTLNPELDKKDVLINSVMGLCGESGEAIDIVKKWLAQGHELDREHLAKELGGISSLTAITIILTGVFGNVLAQSVCKIFRITHPIAVGTAIGTSSHAGGTAKAIEIGKTEGAISGLAIAVAGLMTVVVAPIVMGIMK